MQESIGKSLFDWF